jgi:hypothetical protein
MAGRRPNTGDAVVEAWRNSRLGIKPQAEIEADRRAELRVGATGEQPNRTEGTYEIAGALYLYGEGRVIWLLNGPDEEFVFRADGDGIFSEYFKFRYTGAPGEQRGVFEAIDASAGAFFDLDTLDPDTFNGQVNIYNLGLLKFWGDTDKTVLTATIDSTTGDIDTVGDIATTGTLSVASINTTGTTNLGDSQSDLTTITGKLATAGNAPGVAVGAAAGTGASVGTITGNDVSGRVVLNTGTSPTTGTLCTVTFDTARGAAPNAVMVSQQSAAGGVVDLYATSITSSSFVIGCGDAPAGSSTITVGWFVA